MIIDVLRITRSLTQKMDSYPGLTKFKNEYKKWFTYDAEIYIRQIGKKGKGSWRLLKNRYYEFYRCPRITSYDLVVELNFRFDALGV